MISTSDLVEVSGRPDDRGAKERRLIAAVAADREGRAPHRLQPSGHIGGVDDVRTAPTQDERADRASFRDLTRYPPGHLPIRSARIGVPLAGVRAGIGLAHEYLRGIRGGYSARRCPGSVLSSLGLT